LALDDGALAPLLNLDQRILRLNIETKAGPGIDLPVGLGGRGVKASFGRVC